VDVSWEEPTPNCTTSSSNNPGTSGSFPVGEYVRTYKYTINQGKPGSFEFQCHVNIAITGTWNILPLSLPPIQTELVENRFSTGYPPSPKLYICVEMTYCLNYVDNFVQILYTVVALRTYCYSEHLRTLCESHVESLCKI
jgi:hypothetical protein